MQNYRKGDWVKSKAPAPIQYYQVYGFDNDGNAYLRLAGEDQRKRSFVYFEDMSKHFEPATLRPDFRNSKAGDKAFCVVFGYVEIDDIDDGDYPVTVVAPPGAEIYQIDGLYQPYAKHPSLFHDHYQANAHFAEAFRILDEEMKDGE